MRLWPRYPAGHPVTDGRRLEVRLVARQLWWVAKNWRKGARYGWRSGFVYGPPIQGPKVDGYGAVRARLDTLPSPLTEERVREIVREEMARSVPDLRVVVGSGGTVRVVRSGQTIGRTPGLAGSMKK